MNISEKNINELLDPIFEAKLLTEKQCEIISFCVAFTFDFFNHDEESIKIFGKFNLKILDKLAP
jgi:hypothetical protein